jgi:hypothetical protein
LKICAHPGRSWNRPNVQNAQAEGVRIRGTIR